MLIAAKILITFFTVVLLAVVAERLGPRYAGLLSGFPLGTGIALYFFGWQQGPEFAAESAVYTLSGLSAAICLAAGYWWTIRSRPALGWLPLAMAVSMLVFLLASSLLQWLPAQRWLSLAVVVVAILLSRRWFRVIPDVMKPDASDPRIASGWFHHRWSKLVFRALMASLTILLITGLADWLGPERAGLLAAFPVSFFPLLIILHLSQGTRVLATAIRHYPDGLGALVVYSLSVSYLYPLLGLHWGTAASLLASVGYLVVYALLTRHSTR